jgi:hypothetical protein
MTSNSCPECGKILSIKERRCACGWFKPESKEQRITDRRCQYVSKQRHCPLPGTMSPYTASSTWYCRRHYRTLGDPRIAESELRYIEENFQNIMDEEYRDWRTNLFD